MIEIKNLKTTNPKDYDEVWVIVRSIKQLNPTYFQNGNVKHVPDLSPSFDLFQAYLRWKKCGAWCKDTFRNRYIPDFISSMKNNKNALKLLENLTEMSHEKRIALVCFCDNEQLCHRSIVGGILMNLGAEIKCNSLYSEYKL